MCWHHVTICVTVQSRLSVMKGYLMLTMLSVRQHIGQMAYLLSPDGSMRYKCQIVASERDIVYVRFLDTGKIKSVYPRNLTIAQRDRLYNGRWTTPE